MESFIKWKVFWLRSLGASILGEAIFVVLAISAEFIGIASWSTILQLITMSFLLKIVVTPILVVPFSLITAVVKKIEGVLINDSKLDFNPLKIKLSSKTSNESVFNTHY